MCSFASAASYDSSAPGLETDGHLTKAYDHYAGVQVLMNRLLIAQISGTVPVLGALLLHEHWSLWSTLNCADTAALYCLSSAAMVPAAQAAAHPSLTKRITSSLR